MIARLCAAASLLLIMVSLTSGCRDMETEQLARLRETCKTFKFVLPPWRSAADALKRRIKTKEVEPWQDARIFSHNTGENSLDLAAPDQFTVTVLEVYELGVFRFNMRLPTYNRYNGSFTLIAPETTPISCDGSWYEHL
jgi:hypothetical protein